LVSRCGFAARSVFAVCEPCPITKPIADLTIARGCFVEARTTGRHRQRLANRCRRRNFHFGLDTTTGDPQQLSRAHRARKSRSRWRAGSGTADPLAPGSGHALVVRRQTRLYRNGLLVRHTTVLQTETINTNWPAPRLLGMRGVKLARLIPVTAADRGNCSAAWMTSASWNARRAGAGTKLFAIS